MITGDGRLRGESFQTFVIRTNNGVIKILRSINITALPKAPEPPFNNDAEFFKSVQSDADRSDNSLARLEGEPSRLKVRLCEVDSDLVEIIEDKIRTVQNQVATDRNRATESPFDRWKLDLNRWVCIGRFQRQTKNMRHEPKRLRAVLQSYRLPVTVAVERNRAKRRSRCSIKSGGIRLVVRDISPAVIEMIAANDWSDETARPANLLQE